MRFEAVLLINAVCVSQNTLQHSLDKEILESEKKNEILEMEDNNSWKWEF